MFYRQINLQVVVETPEFMKQAELITNRETIDKLISFIAKEPLAGEIITGTGGARKVRWNRGDANGKRAGMRVIYYYHDESIPIFLFTAYAKNQRENITKSDKACLKKIIAQIVSMYKRGLH